MSEKRKIDFVVTDLDDTLWDWLKMWTNSFTPFINSMSNELNLNLDDLKKSFKKLHQKYHTSEASPFIEELELLSDEHIAKIRHSNNGHKSIMHQYNSDKKHNLYLYGGVFETLKFIKDKGGIIVGYTESNSFFTKYRIKHFDVDGIIDRVYAPIDTGVPIDMKKYYDDDFWEPRKTEFKYLPKDFKKPDAEILKTILQDYRASRESTIYIGDKLDRDIYMAQQASVTSVYAEYGHLIDSPGYELLRHVTHWTDEDVQREKDFKANYHSNPKPDYVLKSSFKELFNYFEFSTFDV